MGLFSSDSKDRALSRHNNKTGGQPGVKRRIRGEGLSQQDHLPDSELPEKQRARRRLVGAIMLVLAAVIVLPMALDSRPPPFAIKNVEVDIADAKPAMLSAAGAAVSKTPAVTSTASASAARAVVSKSKSRALPESLVYARAVVPKLSATSAAGRFVVLAGVFGSDATARAGLKALKAVGVPAYLEQADKSNGTPRIMLHAGPFNDRASAEAAVKKIRQAGLSAPSKE